MSVIDPIPVELDAAELTRRLKPPKLTEELVQLLEKARPLIEPKAACTSIHVARCENDLVYVESGHALRGIVIADMLEAGQEIIPYVVTIGPRLETEIGKEKNLLHSYLLDMIGTYALHKAMSYVKSCETEVLGDERGAVSDFSPGTGTGALFGLEQQKPLFEILHQAVATIGVHLSSSLMMVPRKSESGILAATQYEYVACAHCPRKRCDSRSTPFVGEYQRTKRI